MKTAIVTGSTGNLGQAVISKLIAQGYKVIGTVIPGDTVKPDFSVDQFEAVELDLLNEDQSDRFVGSVVEKYKRIDTAILTVGGFATGKIIDTNAANIRKQYQLNFETTWHIARPVFRQMMAQDHGKIFFIGAKPGLQSHYSKGMVPYGLAKSLVFRLAEMINDEAEGSPVSASVIVPGTIDTHQNRLAMPDADFTKWVTPAALAEIIYRHCSAVTRTESVIEAYEN